MEGNGTVCQSRNLYCQLVTVWGRPLGQAGRRGSAATSPIHNCFECWPIGNYLRINKPRHSHPFPASTSRPLCSWWRFLVLILVFFYDIDDLSDVKRSYRKDNKDHFCFIWGYEVFIYSRLSLAFSSCVTDQLVEEGNIKHFMNQIENVCYQSSGMSDLSFLCLIFGTLLWSSWKEWSETAPLSLSFRVFLW